MQLKKVKLELFLINESDVKIFSKYDFKEKYSNLLYSQKVSIEVVKACAWHFLNLEIVASSLNRQTRVCVEEEALQRLKNQ